MHIKNFDPFYFNKKIINNVPIYYKNIPWSPCIYVEIVFNTGGLADDIGKEGTAHFMEHVTLKGSPKFPDEKDWRDWKKKYTFMTSNAYTSLHNVYYPFKCLSKDYEKVMLDIKDMIFNCFLKEEDIESERNVILQESWGRYKNEKYLKYIRELRENLYKDHPYERFFSPLGWPDTIKRITVKDVRDYHKNNFGIGNFHILLIGNIEKKDVDFIKEFTKDLPILKNKKLEKRNYKVKNPIRNFLKINANNIGEEKEQVEITFLRISKILDSKKYWISVVARGILWEILNDSFRVNHKICYSVQTRSRSLRYAYSISINLKTSERDIDLVLSEFREIIKNFSTNMYEERFKDTKKLIGESTKIKEYLSSDIIDESSEQLINFNHIESLRESLKLIRKVVFKDVQRFIKEMFGDENKYYTEIILPSKKENKKEKRNVKK